MNASGIAPIGLRAHDVTRELNTQAGRVEQRYRDLIKNTLIKTAKYLIALDVICLIAAIIFDKTKLLERITLVDTQKIYAFYDRIKFNFKTPSHSRAWLIGNVIGVCVLYLPIFIAALVHEPLLRCLSAYKAKSLLSFKSRLKDKYEKDSLLQTEDLVAVIKQADELSRPFFISQLNFEQLGVAKQVLREKAFKQCIATVQKEPHQQWQTLLSLPQENATSLIQRLNSWEFKQISCQNPFFSGQLQERLHHVKDEKVHHLIDQLWLNWLDGESLSDDPVANIQINDDTKTVKVNIKLLKEYSKYFEALLCGQFREKTDAPLIMKDIENPEAFKVCLDLLSHQGDQDLHLNKERLVELFQHANFLVAPKLLLALENYVISHLSSFSETEIDELISECPDFTRLKSLIEERYRGQKNISSIWQVVLDKARAINSSVLKDKCLTYAKEQVYQALENPVPLDVKAMQWFKRCQELLRTMKDDSYRDFRAVLIAKMEIANFRLLYELSLAPDQELRQECLNFCQQHAQTIKDHQLWSLGTTPREIAAILYPKSIV